MKVGRRGCGSYLRVERDLELVDSGLVGGCAFGIPAHKIGLSMIV